MLSTAGTFLWSKPCKKACSNPGMQMWNYLGHLGMRIKSSPMPVVPRHCGDDAEVKAWHLTPAMSPVPMVPGYRQLDMLMHISFKPRVWSVYAVRSKDSSGGPKLSSCDNEDYKWSNWADAQADLNLRWTHMSFRLFCCALAHMYVINFRPLDGDAPYIDYVICDWFHYEKELGYTCKGYSVEVCSWLPRQPCNLNQNHDRELKHCFEQPESERLTGPELPHPLPLPMSTNAKRLSFFLYVLTSTTNIPAISWYSWRQTSCFKKQIYCLPWK